LRGVTGQAVEVDAGQDAPSEAGAVILQLIENSAEFHRETPAGWPHHKGE
jgi:hypothetical protein